MVRVFASGLGHRGSIPGLVIPKTQKMVLDVSLFNTQHYKVRIKRVVASEKGAFAFLLHYGRSAYVYLGTEDLVVSLSIVKNL